MQSGRRKGGLLARPESDARPRFVTRKCGRGACVINPKGNDANSRRWNPEISHQFISHSGCVHQDVMTQPILDPQRKAVKPTVATVSLAGVDVMRRKDYPFSKKTVIEH